MIIVPHGVQVTNELDTPYLVTKQPTQLSWRKCL